MHSFLRMVDGRILHLRTINVNCHIPWGQFVRQQCQILTMSSNCASLKKNGYGMDIIKDAGGLKLSYRRVGHFSSHLAQGARIRLVLKSSVFVITKLM